ncbi:MAG: HaeII family restriction endonuclease [Candidatus Magasanikbacteria bacterium]|nr:HaeII family restriction endonuclease [Candidatus Magasanikbacteria bacterium]
MTTALEVKNRIGDLFERSSVYSFRLIRIAETLHHHRTGGDFDLSKRDDFESESKEWSDEISRKFFGYFPTDKQINTRHLFEANAMPPELLAKLGEINKKSKGVVEAYIYKALEARLSSVREVEDYIRKSTPDTFDLKKLVAIFQTTPGLRRSVDKMYEILVYALFTTIVRALKAQVTLEIGNKDKEILKDFERFIKMVLGIDAKQTRLVSPAALYRVGVTNASDRGLDIWANFGPAIQVKHLTLTPELMEDIADDITSDRIVIVCIDTERETIEALLKQVGWSERIQGVITVNDLDDWYKLCLSKKYRANLGAKLLQDVGREFAAEFPSSKEIAPFMAKREYDKIVMPSDWQIQI